MNESEDVFETGSPERRSRGEKGDRQPSFKN